MYLISTIRASAPAGRGQLACRRSLSVGRRVALLGFPEDRNSSFMRGAAGAPPLVRAALSSPASNAFSERGVDLGELVTDFGDLPREDSGDHDHAALLRKASPAILRILSQDHVPLVLGGDHSITYAVVKSIARAAGGPPPVIIHFDAHPDIYDSFEGSLSSHACQMARICEEGLAARLISLGVRTLTPHQRRQVEHFGVHVVAASDFPARGELGPLLEGLVPPGSAIYLSLDVDVLEPGLAPGVSHREAGGLTPRQCIDAIQALPGEVIGADVVEFNPSRDVDGLTASVVAKLVKEIAGRIILGSNRQ